MTCACTTSCLLGLAFTTPRLLPCCLLLIPPIKRSWLHDCLLLRPPLLACFCTHFTCSQLRPALELPLRCPPPPIPTLHTLPLLTQSRFAVLQRGLLTSLQAGELCGAPSTACIPAAFCLMTHRSPDTSGLLPLGTHSAEPTAKYSRPLPKPTFPCSPQV